MSERDTMSKMSSIRGRERESQNKIEKERVQIKTLRKRESGEGIREREANTTRGSGQGTVGSEVASDT